MRLIIAKHVKCDCSAKLFDNTSISIENGVKWNDGANMFWLRLRKWHKQIPVFLCCLVSERSGFWIHTYTADLRWEVILYGTPWHRHRWILPNKPLRKIKSHHCINRRLWCYVFGELLGISSVANYCHLARQSMEMCTRSNWNVSMKNWKQWNKGFWFT